MTRCPRLCQHNPCARRLTPALRAKAQELGHNPVAIFNWVRNTIEYIPTWGAIQSAQDTLDKQRGNAIDIASLQIALLRASNIPARYQFGTVDIPAAQAMNWVGNAQTPAAALQILNQGGIAARAMTQGGQITAIRMEHAWVQAYVNWTPSRGARNGTASQHVNPNGALNAWVALDASHKQYSYAAGMDLSAVPLNAQALLDAAQSGATVNEQQGWVQNLNQGAIQAQLTSYQNQLKAYIDSQAPNATVGDVIGKKIIPQTTPSVLAGVTPLAAIQTGQQTAAIPRSLQHQFSYTLSDNWGSELLSYSAPTSRLAGKRLTLSYTPADQASADLIASYLPKPHADGSPIQPSELPSSLPGYLLKLKPQIMLDGQVVAQSSTAVTMGTDLQGMGGFTQMYDPMQWDLTPLPAPPPPWSSSVICLRALSAFCCRSQSTNGACPDAAPGGACCATLALKPERCIKDSTCACGLRSSKCPPRWAVAFRICSRASTPVVSRANRACMSTTTCTLWGAASMASTRGSMRAVAPKNSAPCRLQPSWGWAPSAACGSGSARNSAPMRRTNSKQAVTKPTSTATVKSNTTVRKKVPSISSR